MIILITLTLTIIISIAFAVVTKDKIWLCLTSWLTGIFMMQIANEIALRSGI
jgi:hypothetical protein